jgi:LysR family transcriptional regulator, nitrogen assimilation regulatory protein
LNFLQLRYFAAIAELKSVTRAAQSLRISQPALTRQLRLLEEDIGTSLFLRHHRGVQLTEAGVVLRDRAEVILRLLNEAHTEISKRSLAPAGAIRIGFPPSIGTLLLAAITKETQARLPHLTVHLVEGLSHLLQEWLLSDRIDLALMTALETNSFIASQPLYEEDIWLVMRPSSGSRAKKTFTVRDIADHKLIQTNRNNIMRLELDRATRSFGFSPNVVIEADALPVIKNLVRSGAGSHISPYSAVIDDVRRGDLDGGPIKGLSLTRVIAHRSDRPISLTVVNVMEIARAEVERVAAQSDGAVRPIKPKGARNGAGGARAGTKRQSRDAARLI